MSQRVLVTGGSGYLGRRTIPKLVDAGFEVVALARTTAAADVVHSLGAEVTRGDLEDATSLIGAFQAARADVLLNIASLGFGHAATIVAACTAAGIRRAVFVSTTAIFTRLNAGSKQTRVAAEGTIAASGLDYTIIRPTMIYGGADDRNIARLSQLVRRTRVVPLPGGGARLQQPVHVEDLASALVACLVHSDSIGLEINVAGPEPLTLKEVVKQTASSHQRRVTTVPLPLSPIIALTRLYERASRKPRLKAEQFERLAEDKSFDISTARRVLGYEPRSFAAGLRTDSARQAIGESPTRSQRLGRYVRTISHLRPQQVFARIRLRTQRAGIRCAPRVSGQLLSTRIHPSGDAGWPPTFEPLDRQRYGHVLAGEDILTGRFTLLNRTEVVSNESIWTRGDPPQLWRFHLHYWDWAWGLIALGDRGAPALAGLWRDWARRTGYGRGDAWSPYVVSLRLWTLCGIHSHLDAASDLQAELADSIRVHAAHLRSNVETDVGGNHLIKNLKALLGAGVFLGDERLTQWAVARLHCELGVQILADGGHFELSPSYHAQVLGDLIDIAGLVNAAGVAADCDELERSIGVMRTWLGEFVGPDGSTPVLNDGVSLGVEELTLLGVGAPAIRRRLVVLDDSGYVVARPRPDIHVIFDVGDPGPDSLPAHAQADCLSFVVGTKDGWVVVDTGTSEYGAGPRRQFERSTAAHNTVEVDGADQTEVWGAFRAGRRARPKVIALDDDGDCITLVAQHDGYRSLPGLPVHRRRMALRSDELDLIDEVVGGGHHEVRSRLHLACGALRQPSESVVVWTNGKSDIEVQGDEINTTVCEYSTEFGRRTSGHCLIQSRSGALPAELRWKMLL